MAQVEARPTESLISLDGQLDQRVKELVDTYLAEKERERKAKPKKLAIIATKGTLDWAYPPLILATTAAALGWQVGIFCTFYGLNLIHKKKNKHLAVAPVGNPAMPMPVPTLIGALPGMTPAATAMMKWMFKSKGVAGIGELLDVAVDSGVKLFPCSTTLEVFGYKQTDFIDGVEPVCGAAHFLRFASDAEVTLLV